MDPFTGIGLTASVVQLIQFGIHVAKTCREIHGQGFTCNNDHADSSAAHLTSLATSLRKSLHNAEMQSVTLSTEENDLIDLARKCEDCATKLQHELRKLQTQPHASALEIARKIARTIWKKDAIDKIQEQLERYRRDFETSLLHRLSQRFDTQNLSTNQCFAELNQNLKHIITCLAHSQTSLDTLVNQESDQTRQHVSTQVAHLEQLHINSRIYDEVLNNLFYPEISSRQEQVANEFDGIENSYDWIFDEPSSIVNESNVQSIRPQKQPHWASFSEWLRTGSKIYWINGKAGSGKSTLMHYICAHKRKDELLKEWSAQRQLLTPTFFFWNAGVRQQKSVDGLLRSLIYQILKACPELIACFENELLHSLTEKRLLNALFTLFTQTRIQVAICAFIDGLDEFDGRYDEMLKKIDSINNHDHVKICLSSRPLMAFERAFVTMPSLRLQDLTFDSILKYVEVQLSSLIEERFFYGKHDKQRAQVLLHEIVRRSEGVFLWIVIAVRDVREGLQDIVDLDELEAVVKSMPPGIEDLYMRMLNSIKPLYRREAVKFLQIVLYESLNVGISCCLDLYRLYFIDIQRISEDLPLSYNPVETKILIKACSDLKTRLLTRTVGLLDVTPIAVIQMYPELADDSWYRGEAYDQTFSQKKYDHILTTKVHVHHRTVKEFLVNNNAAKSFMAATGSREEHSRLDIARGTLAYLVHLSQDNIGSFTILYENLNLALHQIATVERLVGAAQSKLMRSLHDYPFIQKGFDAADEYSDPYPFYRPYMIGGKYGPPLDLVGMAANYGMLQHICEILGFPAFESGHSDLSLLDFQQFYSTEKPAVADLLWTIPTVCELSYSNYRQWLSERLKCKINVREPTHIQAAVKGNTLAETYLLSCCEIGVSDPNLLESLALVRILLQEGADPMVRVQPTETPADEAEDPDCFWVNWLVFLRWFTRYEIAETNGIPRYLIDNRVTMDDIFNTTKMLLIQGANINIQIDFVLGSRWGGSLKHYDLRDHELDFEVSSSAFFWLEECFYDYSEFRAFAAVIKPPVKNPWRKIVSIFQNTKGLRMYNKPDDRARAYPNNDESEMLWLLIEKWEETGQSKDLDRLRSAMTRVFKAHRPDIRLEEEMILPIVEF